MASIWCEIVEQFDFSTYGEIIRRSKTEEIHNPFLLHRT
jgi:hypothetical protein